MIYLIGGASRSGKSNLALKMLNEKSIPYLGTDVLMMGLKSAKLGRISDKHDDLVTARKMQVVLTPMIKSLKFCGKPYVVEGIHLTPKYIRKMIKLLPGHVNGCILGYPEISLNEKLANIRNYPSEMDDWLIDRKAGFQEKFLKRQFEITALQKTEAEKHNINFFSTAENYSKGISQAFEYLT